MQYIIEQTGKYTLELNLNTKHIGVAVSGGADSAMILWMLCNIITRDKLDIEVSTYRTVHTIRSWQVKYSDQVIKFIKESFPDIKWGKTLTESPEDGSIKSYIDSQGCMHRKLRMEHNDMVTYSGVTLNPPAEEGKKIWRFMWKDRAPNRDWETRDSWLSGTNVKMKHGYECKPFCVYDKRAVLAFYKKYNLLDTLLPLTRTCEGWSEWTNNFTTECKQCWWCIERNWAIADARGIKNWDASKAGFATSYPLPIDNPDYV